VTAPITRPGHLKQSEVGVRADTDDGRALLDAVVEQVERGARRRRPGSKGARPVALVVGAGVGAAQRGQRYPGAGRDGDDVAAGELETVGDAAGSASARVDGGGDADELDARPAQEHGQGARVIGVAAEVGVEIDPHHTSMPQAWEPAPSSMPRSSQRFLWLSSLTRPSPTRQAAPC